MRAHSSLRLGTLHGTTPELLASPWYCAWGFCMVWEAGSPTRRPLLPLNAGTAEPVRVSPPEAVAYLLELTQKLARLCSKERTVEGFGRSRAPVFSLSPAPPPSSRERRLEAKFHYLDHALQGCHASTALWHPDGHGVESGQERPPSCTGDCPDAVVCGRWHAYNRLAGPAAV